MDIEEVDIRERTLQNSNYREVVATGRSLQIVIQCLRPREKIDLEIHPTIDQYIRVEGGQTRIRGGEGQDILLNEGEAVFIHANTWHEVSNPSDTKNALVYTIYSPPEHPVDLIQKKKPKRRKEVQHNENCIVI